MKSLHLMPRVVQYFDVDLSSVDLYANIGIDKTSFIFNFKNIERQYLCLQSIRLTNYPDGYVIKYKYPKDWIVSPKIMMTVTKNDLNIWAVSIFDGNPTQHMYVVFSDEEVCAIRENLQVI